MGQKTSPIGFRTGITLGWKSTWFAAKQNYGKFLVEDQKIRKFIDRRFNLTMPKGAVAKVEIIRTRNEVNVTLHSGRPGVVIGPRGGEIDRVREQLEDLLDRKVAVNVVEIKEPDLDATLVAQNISEQLGKRASFRRTMKQQCENAMSAGALGVKIICSGRLAGSEMARKETQKLGSIPLHTLDANVDYATATGRTTYGAVGVKVWIYRGKFGEEPEPNPNRRRRPRREGGGGGGRGNAPARRGGGGPAARANSAPAAAPAPAETPAAAPESSPTTES
ncbi:30S ribosomal protein S3 [Planctomycetota bacterium]